MKQFILILLFTYLSIPSKACSCIGESTAENEIKKSEIVVLGKVNSIERVYIKFKNLDDFEKIDSTLSGLFLNKISFQVTSIFKGKRSMKNITIYTGIGGGDCGFYFKKGLEYILYASKQNLDFSKKFNTENFSESFWTDICTRTQKQNSDEIKRISKFRKRKR
jgi:hypothetical protein